MGLDQPTVRSFYLPFIQDNSQVRLLSIRLFQDLMEYCMEEREKILQDPVHQNLLPLFFHFHDENAHVAEVRTRELQASPLEGARLPPALVSGGLQPPPGLGTGTQVLWGHLHISAAFQASTATLLCAAKFLRKSDLKKLVKEEKIWKFAECLIRMAWKQQAQPGEAPCPWCSLCVVGSCGPDQC